MQEDQEDVADDDGCDVVTQSGEQADGDGLKSIGRKVSEIVQEEEYSGENIKEEEQANSPQEQFKIYRQTKHRGEGNDSKQKRPSANANGLKSYSFLSGYNRKYTLQKRRRLSRHNQL